MLKKRYMKKEYFKVKASKKIHQANTNRYKAQIVILTSKKIEFMAKTIKGDQEDFFFLYKCNSY